MYHLTAKTGSFKGASWLISEAPIVLGRDVACEITINDPIVSRRHCEIGLSKGALFVNDLGSSNATFVNGVPIKHAELKVGDEIAVGNAIFFITSLQSGGAAGQARNVSLGATHSLKIGEPTYLSEDEESLFAKGKPRTAEDLATLFNIGRALSRCESLGGLVEVLTERIQDRFNPEAYWVALCQEEQESLLIFPMEEATALTSNRALNDIVVRAIYEPKGILLPERWTHEGQMGIRTTLVAPMALGKESVGAIVVQVDTPKRIYDENDLEFLLAVAHAAAPYLKAVERLEQLERENQRLLAGTATAGAIIGTGRAIARIRAVARTCARSGLNVLIMGDTGTGKELVARLIHDLSDRAGKPLTIVNCAAIPDELFESELFGYERGAFTGAHANKTGLFEESDGGTLFLDEVGDLSLHNQARLLRAIETGTFRRLGARSDIKVDVRVICATNKNLAMEVNAGRFRRDLYHRLNAFEIQIPPLRERTADIPLLAEYFLNQARGRFRSLVEGFEPEAIQALQERAWPGNVRELRNVIERSVVVAKGKKIRLEDFTAENSEAQNDEPFPSLEELEREHIARAVQMCGGNIPAAADMLKIGRSTLYRKVAEYGIST
ncbi:MAG TPA: sigma 54-interacting transcriptional regulator [Candidatus Hydrogenedentes bacterium]|nr:sigma 54-interacting transcriptional regulator [Candidatus Hydrogenedentota bacterium]